MASVLVQDPSSITILSLFIVHILDYILKRYRQWKQFVQNLLFCIYFMFLGAGGGSAPVKEPSSGQNIEVTQPVAAAPGNNNNVNLYEPYVVTVFFFAYLHASVSI